MATELEQASTMVQEALLRELGDEVDLIILYGSHLRGDGHKYSDLDLCFIPANESTRGNITVLLDDKLIDLFPMHWSRFEDIAQFNHVFCTILIDSEIIYQRTEEAAHRFLDLRARFRTLLEPKSRPAMLRKAQALFQGAGYHYYLLHEAVAGGHQLAAMRHAQEVLKIVLHSLAVLNQTCIDTRKLDQVLALPQLPEGFAQMVETIMTTADPRVLLQATETLMAATRDRLLAEQTAVPRGEADFAAVFSGTYPEFKAGIQHLMLACEREDPFTFELTGLYHELMIHMAEALTGIGYSDFNSIEDYEQDLAALGFPDLLPYIEAGDFDCLHAQCRIFDRRLQEFLAGYDVPLNSFATLDELQAYLKTR